MESFHDSYGQPMAMVSGGITNHEIPRLPVCTRYVLYGIITATAVAAWGVLHGLGIDFGRAPGP